jgi:hypothetical protein
MNNKIICVYYIYRDIPTEEWKSGNQQEGCIFSVYLCTIWRIELATVLEWKEKTCAGKLTGRSGVVWQNEAGQSGKERGRRFCRGEGGREGRGRESTGLLAEIEMLRRDARLAVTMAEVHDQERKRSGLVAIDAAAARQMVAAATGECTQRKTTQIKRKSGKMY